MKKFFATLCVMALTAMAFNANAAMWLVGDAFNGWNESGNVEMTADGDIYTWSGELTAGKYFAFFKDTQGWSYQRGPAAGDGAAPTGDWEDTKAGGSWRLATSGTYEIQYNYATNKAKIALATQEQFDATKLKFAVTGAAFGGWNMPPAANQTFTNNGDGTYTLNYDGALAGEFKLSRINIDANFDSWNAFDAGVIGAANLAEGDNTLSSSFGTANLTFPVSGNVILTISDVTETSCKLNIALEQEVVPDKAWYIAGSFTDWETGKLAMTKNDDGTFSITVNDLAAGAQFKFVDEYNKWYGGYTEDGTNYGVHPEYCTDIEISNAGSNFEITNGSGNLTFTLSADNKLTITGWSDEPIIEPAIASVQLRGSADADWANITTINLTNNEGLWTVADQQIPAGFEFKVVEVMDNEQEVWIGAQSEGNFWVTEETLGNDITMLVPGENLYFENAGTFSFSFNADSLKLNINGQFEPVTEPAIASVQLRGSADADWANITTINLTNNEGLWTVADQQIPAGFEFKVVEVMDNEQEVWIGAQSEGNFWVTEETLGNDITMLVPGENLYFENAGTFSFSFNADSLKLNINGQFEPAPVDSIPVYILGEVNDNGGWFPNVGTEMATTDYVNYTATITTKGENVPEGEEVGYSYFSFTTKLAENDYENGGWDEIANYRFGAVSDGDFLVTDETLDTELALTTQGYQAYKILAGVYDLKLNRENMTLIISKKSLLNGDVDGSGIVDVDDVNAVINIILEKEPASKYPGNADIDGNGIVDVDDVNDVINIILAN